jgi:hypothetical protein
MDMVSYFVAASAGNLAFLGYLFTPGGGIVRPESGTGPPCRPAHASTPWDDGADCVPFGLVAKRHPRRVIDGVCAAQSQLR